MLHFYIHYSNIICIELIVILLENIKLFYTLSFLCLHIIKIGQKLLYRGTQKNHNTLRPMDGISYSLIFAYLDCAKYTEIHIYFFYGQKHANYKIWNELHACLTYRASQKKSDTWVTMSGNCRSFISSYFRHF